MATAPIGPAHPTVLLVDDNRDLLHFLERLMADAGWTLLTAENATDAKRLMQEHKPNAALLDYMLPDGNGVELGVEFLQSVPQMLVIVMTGTILPPEEEALCEEHDFPVLRKPFLASDVMNQIRSRLLPVTGVARAWQVGQPILDAARLSARPLLANTRVIRQSCLKWLPQSCLMPHTFPSTAQSALIVGRTPGPRPTPLGRLAGVCV